MHDEIDRHIVYIDEDLEASCRSQTLAGDVTIFTPVVLHCGHSVEQARTNCELVALQIPQSYSEAGWVYSLRGTLAPFSFSEGLEQANQSMHYIIALQHMTCVVNLLLNCHTPGCSPAGHKKKRTIMSNCKSSACCTVREQGVCHTQGAP